MPAEIHRIRGLSMKFECLGKIVLYFFAMLLLFSSQEAKAMTPVEWKNTGFAIDGNNMTLGEVLNEFGKTYGVRIHSKIRDQVNLKGKLKAENGSDFLDRLMHTHDFRWFVYGGVLYLSSKHDNQSLRLDLSEDTVQDAKSALQGVGLFEQKFGWGELPDEGAIIINGPTEYVRLVQGILKPETKAAARREKKIMLFKLKYATAADRVITTRGQKETIAGVKTLLTSLLNQDGQERNKDTNEKFDIGSEKRSRLPKGQKAEYAAKESDSSASNAVSRNSDNERSSSGHARKSPVAREDKPRIDADTALNAIVIFDYGDKHEMYKDLLAELDVEPQQVEIEALIIDIERSKLAEMGVEWGFNVGNTAVTLNAGRSDSKGVELPVPGSSLLINNLGRFYARLKAMEGKGEARVLGKPTVLTLNNVAAVLDLSQTTYVPLVGERIADLANVTAGTMLRVVPRVLQEGKKTRVRLEVDIEDGSLGDNNPSSKVTRSSISTQAIIDLQQTLMIGGYHLESRSQKQQKMPGLGDMPLIGGLFRSQEKSIVEHERLFLITPRIIPTSGMEASENSSASTEARRILSTPKESLPQARPEDTSVRPATTKVKVASPDEEEKNIMAVTGDLQEKKKLELKLSESLSFPRPQRSNHTRKLASL